MHHPSNSPNAKIYHHLLSGNELEQKSLFPQSKTGFSLKIIFRISAVSSAARLSGYIIMTGPFGFAPSGYPEFTFSETTFLKFSYLILLFHLVYYVLCFMMPEYQMD